MISLRKTHWAIAFFLGLSALLLFLVKSSKNQNPRSQVTATAPPPSPPRSEKLNFHLEKPISPLAMPSKNRRKPKPPTARELADDVRINPHNPPLSLVRFAMEMSPRLEEALRNENAAQKLFGELENCVTDKRLEGAVSTQAVCLNDAKQITEKHASLGSRYDLLTRHASPQALLLSNTVSDASQ
jgi:hypothetical protein